MQGNHSQKHILDELFLLDPSLREKERDVCAIIATLQAQKPTVEIDSVFMANLKNALLEKPTKKQVVLPLSNRWGSWYVPLVPFGVLVLILLIVVPQLSITHHKTTDVIHTTSFDSAPESTKSENTERSIKTEEATEASFMQLTSEPTNTDTFLAEPQPPGTIVTIAYADIARVSFFAVHHIEPEGILGRIVGVSGPTRPGHNENISIQLTTATHIDETYFIALYPDDGDGVFTESDRPIDRERDFPFGTFFSIVHTNETLPQ